MMKTLYEQLERRLRSACSLSKDPTNPCVLAVLEHLEAGGQRVRAKICLDAALRLALSEADAICLASACELLHNASLIHDDLLDRTPTRRGAPSIWEKYGDTVAVCAGDLLLSAAYRLLSEISTAALIGPALQLVHLRTEELILGEASEAIARADSSDTVSCYERIAKEKSASLLSLSLELPLLVSGNTDLQPVAHAAATEFAIAYQIADDFADVTQDARERSPNLLLMFIETERLTATEAYAKAAELAEARLASMQKLTDLLPNGCANLMLAQAHHLRTAIAESMQAA
jgi:geranylgeranyl pyrophosphate synthase